MGKKPRIAQFGTYDIESLGDTMFPKMLEYGLKKFLDCDIELFSMTECTHPYNGNSHVFSFEQFHNRHAEKAFDYIVIGGGEFLHFKKMDVTINGISKAYPEGYIWKKPLEYAKENGIPAIINCVGVPYDLTGKQQEVLRDYLSSAYLVSVRDVFSHKRMLVAGIDKVNCYADNLWYMNQMYPKKTVNELRKELENNYQLDLSTPYILVQYGTTKDATVLAEELKKIKAESGCRICLMPINYCHEDYIGTQLLSEAGDGTFEIITDYLQPLEMIAVISGARTFIGTSLHGNLTAASYGVPFLGIDMYPGFVSKMDGIFTMMGCERYLVPRENGIASAFLALQSDIETHMAIRKNISQMQLRLDQHFSVMADVMK